MLRIIKLVPLFLWGFLLTACTDFSKDESLNPFEPGDRTGQVDYLGRTYLLRAGFVEDYGQNRDFYNLDFYLFDTEVRIQTEADGTQNGIPHKFGGIGIYLELFAPKEADYDGAIFTYSRELDDKNGNYFRLVFVFADENNNGSIRDESTPRPVGGTIQTLKTPAGGWRVELDITFDNEAHLTGSYEGELLYLDKR